MLPWSCCCYKLRERTWLICPGVTGKTGLPGWVSSPIPFLTVAASPPGNVTFRASSVLSAALPAFCLTSLQVCSVSTFRNNPEQQEGKAEPAAAP